MSIWEGLYRTVDRRKIESEKSFGKVRLVRHVFLR
jgi:hypothetical protein